MESGAVVSQKTYGTEVSGLKKDVLKKNEALPEAASILLLQTNFGNFTMKKVSLEMPKSIIKVIEITCETTLTINRACETNNLDPCLSSELFQSCK